MEILDTNQLNDLLMIENSTEEKIIEELLQIYQTQLQDFLTESAKALENQDLFTLSSLAHSLKSSAGNLGFNYPREICLFIEKESKLQNLTAYEEKINNLITESKIATESLIAFLKNQSKLAA